MTTSSWYREKSLKPWSLLAKSGEFAALIKKQNIKYFFSSSISMQTPSINDNDLPILSKLKSFHLKIQALCDIRSISYILRCMPNLIRLYFIFVPMSADWPFPGELLDGYVWKQMFELHVPYLSTFEFHMSIVKKLPSLDLDIIVNSFECFVREYSNWHMIIDRWRIDYRIRGK